ncbi:MAG: choice-of-anchor Q domain-containing protein [Anaerolineae bacterium]
MPSRWIVSLRAAVVLVIGIAFSMTFPVYAAGVVGTGTAASCTEAALDAALSGGGTVTFNCGAAAVTIPITGSKTISRSTTIDGGDLITLDGGDFMLIFYNAGSSLTLQNITLTRGRGIDGGAIVNDGGALTITNARILRSAAVSPGSGESGSGGAIYSRGGTLGIFNSRFTGNRADRRGGAIFINDTDVTIEYGTFFGNRAYGNEGGAIANGMNGVLGGALVINHSSFSLNQAALSGGAIFSTNGGQVSTTDSSFTGNLANTGGAIAIYGVFTGELSTTVTVETLAISRSTFLSNAARIDGGGVVSDVPTTIASSTFQSNNATRDGGALYLTDRLTTGASLTELYLTRNRARRNGGGLYNITRNTLIERSLFANNLATFYGGAIYTRQDTRSGFNLIANNSTFSSNSAASGGGVYDASSLINTWLKFVTMSDNRATDGASLYGTAIRVRNSIIANPATGSNCTAPVLGEGLNIQYPGTSCGTITSIDPLLRPLMFDGGPTRVRPLQAGSPAIDAIGATHGTIGACGEPLDQRGFGRPYDGNGDGVPACDLGAYEYATIEMAASPLTFVSPTPSPTLLTILPTPTFTLPAPVRTYSCQGFALTSPRDGLPNGIATFYWNPAQGITDYAVTLRNENGVQVAQFSAPSQNTNVSGDVSTGAIGAGFSFMVEVQARLDGQPVCRDSVQLLRETTPVATPAPQCGNGIQEPGETTKTCPNGY